MTEAAATGHSDRGAEMSALGSILKSADPTATAGDVFTISPAAEFWGERTLAEVLESMWRSKRPIDPQLVLDHLTGTGMVQKVGGAPHLHDLIERAWYVGNAKFYADAVHEAWRRRTLAQEGLRALQRAGNPETDVTELAVSLMDAAERVYDAGRAIHAVDPPQDVLDFVNGPYAYDWLVPGLIERLDRVMLTGPEGVAKALAWDTPIPTPKGWRLMAELSVGDEVFGPDGQPTSVIAATEVMLGRPCSEVVFSDGQRVVASDDHLWVTETLKARESLRGRSQGPRQPRGSDQSARWVGPSVVTTAEIRATLRSTRSTRALNHAIPVTAPLAYPRVELPVDPYVLGAWLGDGHSYSASITSADPEILDQIAAAGYVVTERATRYAYGITRGGLDAALRSLGLIRNKHVPRAYLEAAPEQRLALLQGLMDTDGTVNLARPYGRGSGSRATYVTTSRVLAEGVEELLIGLGVKASIRQSRATLNGRDVGTAYRLDFATSLPVFRLSRKAERLRPPATRRPHLRYVTAVEAVASVPVRCIQVARDDGLYLAGRGCVPTHNSVILAQIALSCAVGLHPFTHAPMEPRKALVIDCEVSPRQQRRRWNWMLDVAKALGRPPAPGMLRVEPRPDGLDLVGKDLAWAKAKVRASGADLVVIGPLYRLHNRNINDEEVARELVGALDEIRVGSNVALLIEAHAGHTTQGTRGERDLRPRGSSLFLGWTEFGAAIRPVKGDKRIVDLSRWRGDRDARTWPDRLRWGTGLNWPWVECSPDDEKWSWG